MPADESRDTPAPMTLVCTPDTLLAPPAPDALTLQRVDAYSGRDALAELATTRPDAGGDPTDADIAVLVALLGDGLGVLARIGTVPAGGSYFGTPGAETVRIAPVGVPEGRPEDGVDAVVAAELARLAFRMGALRAELELGEGAGDEDAARRYAAAGFSAAA